MAKDLFAWVLLCVANGSKVDRIDAIPLVLVWSILTELQADVTFWTRLACLTGPFETVLIQRKSVIIVTFPCFAVDAVPRWTVWEKIRRILKAFATLFLFLADAIVIVVTRTGWATQAVRQLWFLECPCRLCCWSCTSQ